MEVLVNPEELARAGGKAAGKQALAALRAARGAAPAGAARPSPQGVRVTLFWNSRNGGYLLRSLAAAGLLAADGRADGLEAADAAGCDLVLDAGVLPGGGGPAGAGDGPVEAAVVWGLAGSEPRMRGPEPGVWIPLPRQAWTGGRSEPSGRRPLQAGLLDGRLLGSLTI